MWNAIMLYVIMYNAITLCGMSSFGMLGCLYTLCHFNKCRHTLRAYAACHYAECHYAECRGAKTKLESDGKEFSTKKIVSTVCGPRVNLTKHS
jgi:hypothetical protein